MTDQEKGLQLAEILCIHFDKRGDNKGRCRTTWGTKTPEGLYKTVKRIVEDLENNKPLP